MLSARNIQHCATELAVPPPPPSCADAVAGMASNTPTRDNISTLVQAYPITNAKLWNILKR